MNRYLALRAVPLLKPLTSSTPSTLRSLTRQHTTGRTHKTRRIPIPNTDVSFGRQQDDIDNVGLPPGRNSYPIVSIRTDLK